MSRYTFSFSNLMFGNNSNIPFRPNPSNRNDNITKYCSNPSNQNNFIENSTQSENPSNSVTSEEKLSHLLRPKIQQQSSSLYQDASSVNAHIYATTSSVNIPINQAPLSVNSPIYPNTSNVHIPINQDDSSVNASIYQASVNIASPLSVNIASTSSVIGPVYQDESTVHLETINQLQSNMNAGSLYQDESNMEISLYQNKSNAEIPLYANNFTFIKILDNVVNIINRLENKIHEEKLKQKNYNEVFIKLLEENRKLIEKISEENRKLIKKISEDNKKLFENQEKTNNRLLNLLEKRENKTDIKGEI